MSATSGSGSVRRPPSEESAPKKSAGGAYVVVHDRVGNINLDWSKGRVVLPDDYNDGDVNHPERQFDDKELKRLVNVGAIREATSDEVKAANEAKKAAEEAGEDFTAHYVPEAPPETTIETSARSG